MEIHAESKALTINWGERRCLVLPGSLVPQYLKKAHHQSHAGVDRTKELLSWSWWPNQLDDIREFVASCETCMRRKGQDMQKGKVDMQTLYRAKRPWDCIYVDFIQLDRSKTGKQYCLTVMDGYSRFLSVYPTARCRAIDAARQLMRHILMYDFPKIISSDQGPHFRSELLGELCKLLDIKRNLHVPYRPQSTGCLERAHRTLKNSLYGLSQERNMCWELVLPSVVSTMNKCKNTATRVSPFKIIYGRDPSFGGIQMAKNPSADLPQSYVTEVAATLSRVHKIVNLAQSEADLAAKNSGKSLIKPVELVKGDRVLLNRPMSAESKEKKANWNGPFEVLDSNNVIVRISMHGNAHRHHLILYKDCPRRLDPDFVHVKSDKKKDYRPDAVPELEPPRDEPQRRYPRRDKKIIPRVTF